MDLDKSLNIRLHEALMTRIERFIAVVARKPGDRSRVIRQILAKEAALWLNSPYIAVKSQCLVFVAANGDMFYHQIQELDLLSARRKLPCQLEMKPEKKTFYEQSLSQHQDRANWVRDRWLLNHFAAWQDHPVEGKLLADHVDRYGLTSKTADLPIDQPQDVTVFREIVTGIKDYVQRKYPGDKGDTSDDRADIPIDFPTLNLDLQVMVDLRLYGGDERAIKTAAVNYEIRNSECAVAKRARLGSRDNPITWSRHRHPDERYHGKAYDTQRELIEESFHAFEVRVKHLADEKTVDAKGEPIVLDERARMRLLKLEKPKSYLFGRLIWPMPYQGLKVCLTWNKPERIDVKG